MNLKIMLKSEERFIQLDNKYVLGVDKKVDNSILEELETENEKIYFKFLKKRWKEKKDFFEKFEFYSNSLKYRPSQKEVLIERIDLSFEVIKRSKYLPYILFRPLINHSTDICYLDYVFKDNSFKEDAWRKTIQTGTIQTDYKRDNNSTFHSEVIENDINNENHLDLLINVIDNGIINSIDQLFIHNNAKVEIMSYEEVIKNNNCTRINFSTFKDYGGKPNAVLVHPNFIQKFKIHAERLYNNDIGGYGYDEMDYIECDKIKENEVIFFINFNKHPLGQDFKNVPPTIVFSPYLLCMSQKDKPDSYWSKYAIWQSGFYLENNFLKVRYE